MSQQKGNNVLELPVCHQSDLNDGEMKEVKFGKRKILLSRVAGRFYATSHLCTHQKAPLAKGTLSADGRIMCPWHGACFRVQTGDIEDAPAMDHLAVYKVRLDGDTVIVAAKEEDLTLARRLPVLCKRDPSNAERVVIVGGGAGGSVAAETLRQEGFTGHIVMISREEYVPIDRVKLSKGLKVDLNKILLRPDSFFKEADIELRLGQTVVQVDTEARSLRLDDGTAVSYTKLLLATGGFPKNFWPDSVGKLNVIPVREMDDAIQLDREMDRVKELKRKPRVLIIGSSFIGMEAASVLIKFAETLTVVGMEQVPFERVLGRQIGLAMQKYHESKGVRFRMESVVTHFELDDEKTRCTAAVLKSGEKLPCDIVIIGAGVHPATAFLRGTSIPLQPDGGIAVDEFMRVVAPNISDVFAVGDIARYPYHLPSGTESNMIRVEHWNVAQQQARTAVLKMMGRDVPYRVVPFFWTAQYAKSLRFCGHAAHFDDVIVDGDLKTLVFVAYYVAGEEVVAVVSLGKDPIVSHCSELMRLRCMPTASEIRNGKNPMSIPIGSAPNSAF